MNKSKSKMAKAMTKAELVDANNNVVEYFATPLIVDDEICDLDCSYIRCVVFEDSDESVNDECNPNVLIAVKMANYSPDRLRKIFWALGYDDAVEVQGK